MRDDELLLQHGERPQHLAVELVLGQHRQLVPHAGEPVAQGRGGPGGRGRRVVQLVGEPGGQLAEREQPLPLPDQLGEVALPDEQALQQVDRHRVPLPEHLGERLRGQGEEPAVGDRADRRRVALLEPVAEVELDRAGVHAAVDVRTVSTSLPPTSRTMLSVPSSRTKKHSAGSPSTETSVPAGYSTTSPLRGHPVQLLVVEVLEEEQLAQLVAGSAAAGVVVIAPPGTGARG